MLGPTMKNVKTSKRCSIPQIRFLGIKIQPIRLDNGYLHSLAFLVRFPLYNISKCKYCIALPGFDCNAGKAAAHQ